MARRPVERRVMGTRPNPRPPEITVREGEMDESKIHSGGINFCAQNVNRRR
jgi:hypothetical protein